MHERTHDPPLVRRAHEQAKPASHRARGPSIPMHVRVRRARHLVVHDVIHRGDVEPACGDVRREQDRVGRRLEPVEVLQALPLLELRMQREGGDGEQLEQRLQPPDAVDGGEEDQRAAGVAEEKVIQVRVLRAVSANADELGRSRGYFTLLFARHSILLSLRVATTPPSGLMSTTAGVASRKSSRSKRSSSVDAGFSFFLRRARERRFRFFCRSLLSVAEKTNVCSSPARTPSLLSSGSPSSAAGAFSGSMTSSLRARQPGVGSREYDDRTEDTLTLTCAA